MQIIKDHENILIHIAFYLGKVGKETTSRKSSRQFAMMTKRIWEEQVRKSSVVIMKDLGDVGRCMKSENINFEWSNYF